MTPVIITSTQQLVPYLGSLRQARVMAVDTETTGLDPHGDRLRLVQIAAFGLPVLILDCFSFLPDGRELLMEVLAADAVKVFQNAKFDLQFLQAAGIDVRPPLFDTMLAAQLLNSSGGPARFNLASLVLHFLGRDLPKEEQKSDWNGILREEQLRYAAQDAEILLDLRNAMMPLLRDNRLMEVSRLEFSCVRAIAQMEFHGIHLNLQKWAALRRKTELERDAALTSLYPYTGRPMEQMSLFGENVPLGQNLDSNPYVLSLLRKEGISVEETSQHSLGAHLEHPLVSGLLEYRKASKSLSAFLLPFPDLLNPSTGRLHPRYGQNGAWSGRMSCGSPNIQQIPRDASFRACFDAPPGRRMIIADYSQIELRVAADIARDPRMMEAYRENEDLHKLTASLISGKPLQEITKQDRQEAKAVNFGLIFGMGAKGLQAYAEGTYGVAMTLNEAEKFRERFFDAYTGIAAWHRNLRIHPPKETRTVAGRRHVYGESPGLAGLSNTPVQGSAADIVKQALGLLVDALASADAFLVAAIHDEIIIEAETHEAETVAGILKNAMEQAGAHYLKNVPTLAEVHIADSWAEK